MEQPKIAPELPSKPNNPPELDPVTENPQQVPSRPEIKPGEDPTPTKGPAELPSN